MIFMKYFAGIALAGIATTLSGCATYDIADSGRPNGRYASDYRYDDDDRRYGYPDIGYRGGWYRDYYYPGHGAYVYDRTGRRYVMTDAHRRYWDGWRNDYRYRRGDRVSDDWRARREEWLRRNRRPETGAPPASYTDPVSGVTITDDRPRGQNRGDRQQWQRRREGNPDRARDWRNRQDGGGRSGGRARSERQRPSNSGTFIDPVSGQPWPKR